MSRLSWLQKIYWTRFAKPVQDRELYKQLIQHQIGSILEIGLGDGRRMRRISKLWQQSSVSGSLRYIGTDEFEAATDVAHHLRLKQAHQLAAHLRLKATLIPGDPESAIPRVAHKTGTADLIIADGQLDPQQPRAGVVASWLNHLAHERTLVLGCAVHGGILQLVDWRRSEDTERFAA